MNRLLMLVSGCMLFATINVNAQVEYKPFRVDLGFGYIISNSDEGGILYLEPKYAVIPQLNVGFKCGASIIHRYNGREDKAQANDFVVQGINSYQATFDYHLTRGKFRPFVGTGLGICRIGVLDENPKPPLTIFGENAKYNFGAMFRTGIDISHNAVLPDIRLTLDYNLAGKDKLANNANFISATIGIYFGGGKIKSRIQQADYLIF